MCDPVIFSYMYAAANGIQTAAQILTQNSYAKAEAEAARVAAERDYLAIQEQEEQINRQAALEATERLRQALRERAKLTVIQGEAGISGATPAREISNSMLQESYDLGIIETNRLNRINQAQREAQTIYTTAQSRVNQAKSRVVNPFLSMLMIGGSTFSGWMQGSQIGNILFPAEQPIQKVGAAYFGENPPKPGDKAGGYI